MKKIIMICVALFALCGLSSCNYNSLVEKQQGVDQAWAEVENQYQRRSDLITLTKVTEARAKATSITIDPANLNEETLAKYQAAQNELSGALKSLLAVTEAYPDLKANQNFLNLQAQLEGTENRVTVARKRYTESVQEYNTSIKKFPTMIYAGWFGFKEKPQFKAEAGAEKAPEVKF